MTISDVSDPGSISSRNVSAEVEVELVVGRLLNWVWKRLRRTPVERLFVELEAACLLSGIII